jgi:hypothetical protein
LIEYVEYLASIPGIRIDTVPGSKSAYFEACEQANKAGSEAMYKLLATAADPRQRYIAQESVSIPYYERFVHRYPLTPDGLLMMGMLASQYARVERYPEARRLGEAAVRLSKDTTWECLLEDYLAHVEAAAGDLDAAEARLRTLMTRPLPADRDDRRANDILFVAPSHLAEVLNQKGQYEQADRVLVEVADRSIRLAKERPESGEVVLSWALSAYRGRVGLVLDRDPYDVAVAKRLAEEFKQRVPDYRDPRLPGAQSNVGYEQLLQEIEQYQQMRSLRAETKPSSPPASRPSGTEGK